MNLKLSKTCSIAGVWLVVIMTPVIFFHSEKVINAMDTDKSKGKPVIMMGSDALSDTEISQLERQALKGSAETAFRLYKYYEHSHINFSESLYWARIAAENGHPNGQYALGFRLRNDPDPRNRQRARFWLERSAANGVSLAVELLKEIPE